MGPSGLIRRKSALAASEMPMRPLPSEPVGAGVTGMLSISPCRSTVSSSSRPGFALHGGCGHAQLSGGAGSMAMQNAGSQASRHSQHAATE